VAEPLRILHCLRTPVGGAFRHVCDLAAEQVRRGHDVGVVCDASSGDALSSIRLEELAPQLALGLLRVPMSRELGPRDFTAFRAVRAHAQRAELDVIHGHGAKGGAYSRLVAKRLRTPDRRLASCYTPHGGSLHYHPSSLAGRVYMRLERRLAPATDGFVFESAYARGRYEAHVVRPAGEIRVIPNGVAPADFDVPPPDGDAADLLFVGELRRLKGVDVLLQALARVRAERPVTAAIVGDGGERAALERLRGELGLDAVVAFEGSLTAREAFRLGRALVVPSRAESFPYIVLEAGAAGRPVVATDVGGIPEIVGGTGTPLVPPDDDAALAAALLRLVNEPGAADAHAHRLRDAVAERFTVDTMTGSVLELYQELLDAR
jgi:glycosyltransferase involved in cell wall biosynthesis